MWVFIVGVDLEGGDEVVLGLFSGGNVDVLLVEVFMVDGVVCFEVGDVRWVGLFEGFFDVIGGFGCECESGFSGWL